MPVHLPPGPSQPADLPGFQLALLRDILQLSLAEMCAFIEKHAADRGLAYRLSRQRVSDWANNHRAVPDWVQAIVIRELGVLWRKDRRVLARGSAVRAARDLQWASLFDPVLAAYYQVAHVIPADQRPLLEPLRKAIFADFQARFDFLAPSDS